MGIKQEGVVLIENEKLARTVKQMSDIQGAMIQALNRADCSTEPTDEELLARMREDSQNFADMVRRGFKKIEEQCGL